MENFRVSRQLVHPELIRALATVKQAAVEMNMSLGLLDPRLGSAIFQAAAEIADGSLADSSRWMPCRRCRRFPPT